MSLHLISHSFVNLSLKGCCQADIEHIETYMSVICLVIVMIPSGVQSQSAPSGFAMSNFLNFDCTAAPSVLTHPSTAKLDDHVKLSYKLNIKFNDKRLDLD